WTIRRSRAGRTTPAGLPRASPARPSALVTATFSIMDRKWRVLIIVCVGIFMLLLDITVVNVALPDIQKELHTSFTDLQWVVDAYALLLATCMLNAGTLGDLLGRKRVFIGGAVLFTAASAACGSATSPLFLNLARGLQG